MNDEIKEIKINKANKSVTFINNGIAFSQFGIADEILDLITNLQQLEQEHKKINGELREENNKLEIALQNIQEDYDRRIEENERLKEERKELKDGWQQEVYDKDKILNRWYETQGRIDKAIEYIHKNYYEIVYKTKGTLENDLLNILQNGSDSQ